MLFEIYIYKKHTRWETYFNSGHSFLIPSERTATDFRQKDKEHTVIQILMKSGR